MVECPTCHGTGVVEEETASHAARAVHHLDRVIARSADRPKERGKGGRMGRDRAVSLDAALDAEFGLPDGRRVKWREATKADVEAWVAMLTTQITGLRESRSFGDRALREFVETGARTVGAMPREAQLRIFRPDAVMPASGELLRPERPTARKAVTSTDVPKRAAKKATASKKPPASVDRSRKRAA